MLCPFPRETVYVACEHAQGAGARGKWLRQGGVYVFVTPSSDVGNLGQSGEQGIPVASVAGVLAVYLEPIFLRRSVEQAALALLAQRDLQAVP